MRKFLKPCSFPTTAARCNPIRLCSCSVWIANLTSYITLLDAYPVSCLSSHVYTKNPLILRLHIYTTSLSYTNHSAHGKPSLLTVTKIQKTVFGRARSIRFRHFLAGLSLCLALRFIRVIIVYCPLSLRASALLFHSESDEIQTKTFATEQTDKVIYASSSPTDEDLSGHGCEPRGDSNSIQPGRGSRPALGKRRA